MSDADFLMMERVLMQAYSGGLESAIEDQI